MSKLVLDSCVSYYLLTMMIYAESVQYQCPEGRADGSSSCWLCPSLPLRLRQPKWGMHRLHQQRCDRVQLWPEIHVQLSLSLAQSTASISGSESLHVAIPSKCEALFQDSTQFKYITDAAALVSPISSIATRLLHLLRLPRRCWEQ